MGPFLGLVPPLSMTAAAFGIWQLLHRSRKDGRHNPDPPSEPALVTDA